MRDSRLKQIAALIDDARDLLVDIVDEGPNNTNGATLRDFNFIDSSRQFLNSALAYCQLADSEAPQSVPDQPA